MLLYLKCLACVLLQINANDVVSEVAGILTKTSVIAKLLCACNRVFMKRQRRGNLRLKDDIQLSDHSLLKQRKHRLPYRKRKLKMQMGNRGQQHRFIYLLVVFSLAVTYCNLSRTVSPRQNNQLCCQSLSLQTAYAAATH